MSKEKVLLDIIFNIECVKNKNINPKDLMLNFNLAILKSKCEILIKNLRKENTNDSKRNTIYKK
jgi:hypothetical protein